MVEAHSEYSFSLRELSPHVHTTLACARSELESRPNLNIGIIGVGHRGQSIIRELWLYAENKIQMVAICDASIEALDYAMEEMQAYARAFNGTTRRYSDPETMFAECKLDWVIVSSINSDHVHHYEIALRAGCHVFAEKPLGITIEECSRIYRTVQEHTNQLFLVGFVLRYSPFYRKVKEIVSSGAIGQIVSFEANELVPPDHGGYIMRNWRRHHDIAGSHFLDKCCHDMDILCWLLESRPTKVCAMAGNDIFIPKNAPIRDKLRQESTPPHESLFCSWGSWENVDPFESDKSIEDNCVAIMQFENGARGMFHTNTSCPLVSRRLKICGLEGAIECELFSGKITVMRSSHNARPEKVMLGKMGSHGQGDVIMAAELIDIMTFTSGRKDENGDLIEEQKTLDKDSLPPCFKTMPEHTAAFVGTIICLAVDESAKTGAVVDLNPVWEELNI